MNARRSTIVVVSALVLSAAFVPAPQSAAEDPHRASRRVADALDGVIQPLFQEDGNRFGMDRLTVSVHDHAPVLPHAEEAWFAGPVHAPRSAKAPWLPDRKIEKQVAKVDTKNWVYFVGFFHMAHVPGKLPKEESDFLKKHPDQRPTPKMNLSPLASSDTATLLVLLIPEKDLLRNFEQIAKDATPSYQKYLEGQKRLLRKAVRYSAPLIKGWEQEAVHNAPTLKKGHAVEVKQGAWTLFLRPVKASKPSCVSCHTGAKQGDTLGVMVYAVTETQNLRGKRQASAKRSNP